MKIIFLGTNGWYSTPTGDTACILLDTKAHYIILDAGNGFYKLDTYIKENKPISLFISHFHLDHTSGLHILNKYAFPQGIDVYVGEGRAKDFSTLVNPPFTVGYQPNLDNIVNLKTVIRLHELSEMSQNLPYNVTAIEQKHGYRDHGFRFTLEEKIISYTGDCGLTDSAKMLASNADVLISECSNKKTEEPDIWGHLDPIQAATIAKEAGVKQLILTHFGANTYTTVENRLWAQEQAIRVFPKTIAAIDGLEFTI